MNRSAATRLLGVIIGLTLVGFSFFSTPAITAVAKPSLPKLSLPFSVESKWTSVSPRDFGITLETNQKEQIRFGLKDGKFRPGSEDDTWFIYGWFGALEAITKPYNVKYPEWGNRHNGVDFSGKTGLEVTAAAPGKVIFAGWKIGKTVIINIGGGHYITYGHLQYISVKKGEWIQTGDLIGHLGNTGTVNPHLHFQLDQITKFERIAINPVPLFDTEWGNVIIPDIDANNFYTKNQEPSEQLSFSW
ncbi:MAG: M23 family metallopeptidase [Patescibacteria group bacterium]|nr:M23 family metallopeptidase [Patescibacteria group bacterium]